MRTADLIGLLAADDPTRRPGRPSLPLAVALGFALALLLTAAILGLRPLATLASLPVLGKLCFTLALAALAVPALRRALRPGRPVGRLALLPLAAALAVTVLALLQAHGTPESQAWRPDTPYCLVLVPLFSLPGLWLIARAARAQAPTDLPRTGLLVGLLAGAVAATAYAMHCPNDDPLYLAAWYLPAVLIAGLVGRAMGTRILSW